MGDRPRIHHRVLARVRRLGWRVIYGGLSVVVDAVRVADPGHPARNMSTGDYDLIFSHGYGGGSESFLVGDGSTASDRTILATPKWPFVRLLEIGARGGSSKVVTLEWLAARMRTNPPTSVSINGLAGWIPLRPLLEALASLPDSIVVSLPVHDFFPACPSLHLLDVDGRYCGVPPTSRCARCYPRVSGLYIREFGSVEKWRSAWSGVLERANTILAFSESSAAILARAFPGLDATVRPHAVVPNVRAADHRVQRSSFAKVAVFGTLSVAKGAEMLVETAALAASRGRFVEWHVFGDFRGTSPLPSMKLHGAYKVANMPGLIEDHGIVAAVLPSIVPETFSFVAEELIAMGVPFSAFPLGAPYERLQRHDLVHFANEMTAEGLLAATLSAVEAGWNKYGSHRPDQAEADPLPGPTILG